MNEVALFVGQIAVAAVASPSDRGAWWLRLCAGLLGVLVVFCPAVAAQSGGGMNTGGRAKSAAAIDQSAERAAAARSAG
ncbi:MAG: hypothetical protein ACREEP_04215, partial [Dongiaceae bacterium]